MVSVLPRRMFVEVAEHADCVGRRRQDRTVLQINGSVTVKAKYNRGHQLHDKQRWVFGIYDPHNKVGFIQLVDNQETQTPHLQAVGVQMPGYAYRHLILLALSQKFILK